MIARRLQIVLSVAIILFCSGYLVREAFSPEAALGGRSELSECHFLLKHSYVDGADGMELIKAASRALEPNVPPESIPSWKTMNEEEALFKLEEMVNLAQQGGLTQQEAVFSGMEAMVKSLGDPFTSAMDPDAYARFQETLSSQPFGGVGLQLGLGTGGTALVFKVLDQTPASRAGVVVGDIVLSVDDRSVTGLSAEEVEALIRGEPGTAVKVTFSRGGEAYTVKMERVILKSRSVRTRVLKTPGGATVGWITILRMKEETGKELSEELAEGSAFSDGYPDGLVLDLRDNMGGYVNAALEVCSQFLDSGLPVVEIKTREETQVKATLGTKHNTRPLIVLVNGYTGSSAEIVAACLQDYDRAILVGERTFGKGSVQSIHEFDSGGALKFTVARYITPEGRVIDGTGLEPDVQMDEREVLSHCEELWKETVTAP